MILDCGVGIKKESRIHLFSKLVTNTENVRKLILI